MMRPEPDHEISLTATRLANVPLLCWLAAMALVGLCYYLDAFAVYREIRGYPKDRVEDDCLWLAGTAATVGIITSVVGFVVLRRSGGRVRGWYRLSIGMVFNLLTVLVVLFTLYVREILKAA